MQIKSEIARHFDQAGIWQVEGQDYYCYRREEEEYDRILQNNCAGSLLEVGVGRGRFLARYAHKFDSLAGIDISRQMLKRFSDKIADLKLGNISLFQADAEHLNFKDSSFDVVIAPQVIGHCPDPVSFLLELSRVLKKGGRGVVSTANYLSLPGIKEFRLSALPFIRPRQYRNILLIRQKFICDSFFSLRRYFKKAGLKIDSVSGTGIFPTFLSRRAKPLEKLSALFPVKYFCRTIIVSFIKE